MLYITHILIHPKLNKLENNSNSNLQHLLVNRINQVLESNQQILIRILIKELLELWPRPNTRLLHNNTNNLINFYNNSK